MTILVCGSYAYDSIMVFEDKFRNHILPDKVHMINVSFLVPTMRKEFGGCAGNIAYNLDLLGGDVTPMATVGTDFVPYHEWMTECGINTSAIKTVPNTLTGQAFITTDMDDNQITAFHPGAMGESHQNSVSDVKNVKIGIVSPDGRDGMIQHAKEFFEAGIPFMFDPGQGLPMFSGDEIRTFIKQATWVASNDYEAAMIQEKTGLTLAEITEQVNAVIVTKGGEGSTIYADGEEITIPVADITSAEDPTGCGDAYRAGLLYGLSNDLDWKTTGQIASLCGAIKIEKTGTQNHSFTKETFAERYKKQFSEAITL